MKLDQKTWSRVYPWLEKAQDVSAAELPAWIARIVAEQPDVGIPLREVLAQSAALDESFLEGPLCVPVDRRSRTVQQVGAYTIDTLLADGGMGEVWLAHRSDGHFEGKFAVKLLHLEAPGAKALDRFKREGRVLARLTHPHIARLIDAGATADGQPFLVLEYIDGEHVDKYCEGRALSTRSRVRLYLDVLSAVSHAHTSLIIHRDIKPSNVLVTSDGTVKLLDFGIAKLVDPGSTLEERGQLTRIEDVAFTPSYAAPEQILGEPLSTATDVYQLGVLLHVLLVGRLPPANVASTRAERLKVALVETPARMSDSASGALRKNLQGDLDAIIGKSLRKRPGERYATAAALSADLQRYLEHEPVTARDGLFAYRAGKFLRRYRGAVLSVTATLAALVIATAVSLTQEHKIRLERDRADQITGFMTQMFKVADPSEARGNTVTAREILDRSSREIEAATNLDAGVQTDLLQVMAETYQNLGLYARAHDLAQVALERRRQLLGLESPKTLESLQQMGNILFLQGRSAEAEDSLRRTVALQLKILGPEDSQTLETQDALVDILVNKGRFAEGEQLARQIIAVKTRKFGRENLQTLRTTKLLATALHRQDRFAESESLFRQTAAIQGRLLGTDHPETLRTQVSLAKMLTEQGRNAEAEVLYREVLAAERRVFGEEHPETADTLTTLATNLMSDRSRFAEAETLYRQALAIELRQVGPESSFTTRTEQGLANLLAAQKRYADSEPLYREVLRVREKVLGADNADTLIAQYNLATHLDSLDRLEEAEQLLRMNLERRLRVLDAEDEDVQLSRYVLAEVLLKQHRAAEAEPFAHQAFEALQQRMGLQHTRTLTALFFDADALTALGRYGEAKSLYMAAIDELANEPKNKSSRLWYDLACVAARSGHIDDAFDNLEHAASLGYKDADFMDKDEDLERLPRDRRFLRLTEHMRSNAKATPQG